MRKVAEETHVCLQYMHIPDRDRCNWLRERIETPEEVSLVPPSAAKAFLQPYIYYVYSGIQGVARHILCCVEVSGLM